RQLDAVPGRVPLPRSRLLHAAGADRGQAQPAALPVPTGRGGALLNRPAWQRFAIWLASTRAGGWYYVNVAPFIARVLLRISRGKLSTALIIPVVMVEAIGARTGQVRRTPLLAARDGDGLIVVASRGGDSRNPGWYYNL